MQKDIIFKKIDGKVTIIANQFLSFDVFIDALKNRLDMLYIKDDLLSSNVVLDIANLQLDSKKILNIFDVFAAHNCMCIAKIIYKQINDNRIILHEGNIRSGQVKMFANNTLLIGNVNKGAKIIVYGNLYVVGKINGDIEFKGVNNKLMASNIEDAYVKFCIHEKNIVGLKENITVFVDGDKISEEGFMDRREKHYGKSNCSYIW